MYSSYAGLCCHPFCMNLWEAHLPFCMNVGTLITSCAICRFAVKTLMWSMGVQVEVLNMTDSSNTSMVPSVDFLNRSDFDPSAAFPCIAQGSLTLANWP